MPRPLNSQGVPDPLDPTVIEEFLNRHIPYRLALLDLAEAVVPPKTISESAFVEAGIVAGRLLLEFVGLRSKRKGGLRLVPDRTYRNEQHHTDDVKIPDVGGRFVCLDSLDEAVQETLAHFHDGASKSSAHFTWDSGHHLDVYNFKRAIPMIRNLVVAHLPQRN